MKRIIAISALTAVACVGFGSVAHAAPLTATSSQSATVDPTCSLTATGGTFTATTQTINTVAFPVSLASTGAKFTTLCNTATSTITVAKDSSSTVPGGQTPVQTYSLTANGTTYPGVAGTNVDLNTPSGGTAVHSYSNTASDIGVAVNVAAPANKILQDGTYTVVLKATLTP